MKSARLALAFVLSISSAAFAQWEPADSPLVTRWAADVSPDNAWPEYPRPTLVREAWQNLNGMWDYAILNADGKEADSGRILVPFPLESALSGVGGRLEPDQTLVYERAFEIPAAWDGQRVVLHFEASDFRTRVFVNGEAFGEHVGGYDRFSFDITDAVRGSGKQTLRVEVRDPTDSGVQPMGKQTLNPHGIWYTPTSGLWQTVWLEPMPADGIEGVRFETDIDSGGVVAHVASAAAADTPVSVRVSLDGRTVTRASGTAGSPLRFTVHDHHTWTPDSPTLYDVEVTLGDDSAETYFAFREITVEHDRQGVPRFHLNGAPIFLYGTLDQGFWPDGLYTPPTVEAMVYDIEITKELGFNTIRKHVKVEPELWYAACDRLGMLVIQDMPTGDERIGPGAGEITRSPESAAQYMLELDEMIEQHRQHPSIVMWCPHNEGWGQFNTIQIAEHIKATDPTRLVDPASGWNDFPAGDLHDIHMYPGPATPPLEDYRAAFLGEFGGLGLPIEGHIWQNRDNWGYRTYHNKATLFENYTKLMDALRWEIARGLAGAIYTQTTDVEGEVNGLLTYDREIIKMDPGKLREMHLGLLAPPPVLETLVSDSQREGQTWRYTFEEPGSGWESESFDDSSWSHGEGGFGSEGTPGAVVRTNWTGPDIWLRRVVEVNEASNPFLVIHHDEDVEIYFDGIPAASLTGYTTSYTTLPLPAKVKAAFADGRVVIAVHCRQTLGGQYIDLGVVDLEESEPTRP